MHPYSVMSMAKALVLPARSFTLCCQDLSGRKLPARFAKFPIHQSVYIAMFSGGRKLGGLFGCHLAAWGIEHAAFFSLDE